MSSYKKIIFIFIAMFLFFVSTDTSAEEEVIKVSDGYSIVVPKGSEVKRQNGQILVEDPGAVQARKLTELQGTVKELESSLKELKQGADIKKIELFDQRIKNVESQLSVLQESYISMKEKMEETIQALEKERELFKRASQSFMAK